MSADPVTRTRLTEPHRQLVRILAEAAVEDFLRETAEAAQLTDESREDPMSEK